jgi:hypothetical protein
LVLGGAAAAGDQVDDFVHDGGQGIVFRGVDPGDAGGSERGRVLWRHDAADDDRQFAKPLGTEPRQDVAGERQVRARQNREPDQVDPFLERRGDDLARGQADARMP